MKKQFLTLFLMGAVLVGFGFQVEWANNETQRSTTDSDMVLPTSATGGSTIIPGEYSSHSDTQITCAPGLACAKIESGSSAGTTHTLHVFSTPRVEFYGTPVYDIEGNVVAFETANQTMDIVHVD